MKENILRVVCDECAKDMDVRGCHGDTYLLDLTIVFTDYEKTEYSFCSMECLHKFLHRTGEVKEGEEKAF